MVRQSHLVAKLQSKQNVLGPRVIIIGIDVDDQVTQWAKNGKIMP